MTCSLSVVPIVFLYVHQVQLNNLEKTNITNWKDIKSMSLFPSWQSMEKIKLRSNTPPATAINLNLIEAGLESCLGVGPSCTEDRALGWFSLEKNNLFQLWSENAEWNSGDKLT